MDLSEEPYINIFLRLSLEINDSLIESYTTTIAILTNMRILNVSRESKRSASQSMFSLNLSSSIAEMHIKNSLIIVATASFQISLIVLYLIIMRCVCMEYTAMLVAIILIHTTLTTICKGILLSGSAKSIQVSVNIDAITDINISIIAMTPEWTYLSNAYFLMSAYKLNILSQYYLKKVYRNKVIIFL